MVYVTLLPPCVSRLITFIRLIYIYRVLYRWIIVWNCLLWDKLVIYMALHYQHYMVAEVDRTKCAENRYESCRFWCRAMYDEKSHECSLYDIRRRKEFVLEIDMEMPSLMICKVLCRYVDTICGIWCLSIPSMFAIFVINLISSFGFHMFVCVCVVFLMYIHVTSFISYM